ncbi:ABC transporter permease [Clostridiales bacterium COT073_COT-073]|nr:ABC transporter permease [Clostridiales bacterium COT073_COT-073]
MTGSVKSHIKQAFPAMVIVLIMVIGTSIASEGFLTIPNLRNVMTQTSILIVIATAQSFALLTGGIDMSISSVMSLTTIITATFSTHGTFGLLSAILLSIIAGGLIGAVNGTGICYYRIPAMIITISTQVFVKGICLILMPSSGGKIHPGFVRFMRIKIGMFSMPFIIAVCFCIIAFFILHYSRFGRNLYAIGNNELYAEQSGINVKNNMISIYMLISITAVMAGWMLAARIASGNPLAGDSYTMDSIAAPVIGGISMNGGLGTVVGTFLGSVILSLINNIMNNLGISPYFQYIIKGSLLMVSLMLFQFRRKKVL